MIERYSDHAANERTFLAWVRTGIAVIAFGFVVEKFNLFVRTLAQAAPTNSADQFHDLQRLSSRFNHYDGLVLILIGIAIIVVSLVRFARTSRLIDDQEMHLANSVRTELMLAVVLVLVVGMTAVYFALF
jgi:putative membrane protein